KQGLSAEDAEDIAQDVLERLAGGVLERADPERGRLRALVKAVARHALLDHRRRRRAQKRGGRATRGSLATIDPPAREKDDDFDAEWALGLVLRALYCLLESADAGRRQKVEAVYQRAVKGLEIPELAASLGVSESNAKVLLHRGRKLVAASVRELVAE